MDNWERIRNRSPESRSKPRWRYMVYETKSEPPTLTHCSAFEFRSSEGAFLRAADTMKANGIDTTGGFHKIFVQRRQPLTPLQCHQNGHSTLRSPLDDILVEKAQIEFMGESEDELTGEIADAVIKAIRSGISDKDIAMVLMRKACEVMG